MLPVVIVLDAIGGQIYWISLARMYWRPGRRQSGTPLTSAGSRIEAAGGIVMPE